MRPVIIVFIIFYLIPIASLAQIKNLVGTYETPYDPLYRGLNARLKLNADSSYSFEESGEMSLVKCNGKWEVSMTRNGLPLLCLTSDSTTYGISNVVESEDQSDSIKINVYEKDGLETLPCIFGSVSVVTSRLHTDTLGIASGKKEWGIKSLSIWRSPDEPEYRYDVKNSKANIFRVTIIPKNPDYYYMDNMRWEIRGEGLYHYQNQIVVKKIKEKK
jgi:hypothetical protein